MPNCQLMWKDDVSHGTFESAHLVTNTSLFDDDDGSFIISPQWIILRLSCILVIEFFYFSFYCYLLQSMALIVALQCFHIHNMAWKGCFCCPECFAYVLAADSSSIMKTNYLPYLGCPVAIMGFEIRCNLSKRPGPQVTIHSIVPYIHEVSPFKFRFQVHIYAHFKNARERLPGCLSSPHCVCVPLHA